MARASRALLCLALACQALGYAPARHRPVCMEQRDNAAAQRQRRSVQLATLQRTKLPQEVDALLDPGVPRDSVVPNWRQFRACYPSDTAAIAAAQRNEGPLLPFLCDADDIGFCYQILHDKMSEDEVSSILEENPGVLGNIPGQLAASSVGEIRAGVKFVTAMDGVPKPVRSAIPVVTAVAIVAGIANRLSECAGGTCG